MPRRAASRTFTVALSVVALLGSLAACGPSLPAATSDDGRGGELVPTRIGEGPTTTPPASTTPEPLTEPTVQGTLPQPTVAATADPSITVAGSPGATNGPNDTARPSVGLADLPGQVGSGLTDNRVFLLGDDVLATTAAGATNQAARVLEPLGWATVVDAKAGRTPAEALDALRARRDEIGQVVVLLIGNGQASATNFRRELQTMLSLLAGVPKVVLLTVSERSTTADTVNTAIREAGLRESNRIAVVDWDRVARSAKGALQDDGWRPTELGAEVLARTIASVLGPAPGSAG